MPPSRFSKTLLLIDQAQIAIEERNRLLLFGNQPSAEEDDEVIQSLTAVKKELHSYEDSISPDDVVENRNFGKAVTGYQKLLDQLSKDANIAVANLQFVTKGNGKSSSENGNSNNNQSNDAYVTGKSRQNLSESKLSKSVRFKDQLVEDPPAKFRPYRDDPDEQDYQDDYSEDDLYRQNQELMDSQDVRLDSLANSVNRQHQLSIQIDDELSTHIGLLDEVDRLADHSTTRLEQAKRRLDVFSRKAKQNGSWVTICILFLIFIVLVLVLK